MRFESHKIIKEYMEELDKITELREELRNRMVDLWEQSYKTEDDSKRRMLVRSAEDANKQVSVLTARGNHYMLKIDQLNGVR